MMYDVKPAIMDDRTYQIQVYSPPKGLLLLVLLLGICFLLFGLIDLYDLEWLRKYRFVAVCVLITPFLIFFSRLATSIMEIKIDHNGLWLDHLPHWSWGKHQQIHIGWLEIENWIYKKGRSDGHSIWWDRLTFKLSGNRSLLILPIDELEQDEGSMKTLITSLEQAINDYNSRSSTQIPIRFGHSVQRTLFWAWLGALFSLFCCVMCLLAIYITFKESKPLNWMMLGMPLLLLAFVYQLWTRIQTIRNASKP